MAKIKKIFSFEILDSRGTPTLRTKITTEDGVSGESSVPSGSSTGKAEAKELRDGNERYLENGVLKAVTSVNKIIAPKLEGKDTKNQKEIDETLIKLDGTPQKSRLGANAILSVSQTLAKVEAQSQNIPLYKYLNQAFFSGTKINLPTPFSVVIEGGKHSSSNLDVQEFIIVPQGLSSFSEKIRVVSEIYQILGEILKKRNQSVNVGLEGAYGPELATNTEAMDLILEAVNEAGYKDKVKLALDVAASELYLPENEESYYLKSEEITLKKQQLLGLYNEWFSRYPILSIEDGLEQEDWDGWAEMTDRFSKNIMVIGDDLFVTDPERIKRGVKLKAASGVIIKPNQIGTLTETIKAIKLAKEAGWEYIISHRSGDTCDAFIADLAVASGANFIKAGAPSRGERVEKYNRLLEIEKELK